MIIRRASEKEIGGIAELLYQVHKVHSDIRPDIFKEGERKYSDKELLSIIEDESTPVFVAIEGEKVVGHAFCEKKSCEKYDYLYIDDLCVDKEERKKGIGKTLYDHVVAYAKENGFSTITLNVWEGNDSAMQFYKKMGFTTQKTCLERKI